MITKTKKQIYVVFVTILIAANVCVQTSFASSFSISYSLNDESLSFSNSSDTLQSSSYSMDMSNVYWTDRTAQVASYSVADSNSGLDINSGPTPPSASSGNSGQVAGGREKPEQGELDSADLVALEDSTQVETPGDLELHPSSETPYKDLFEELYKKATGEDFGNYGESQEPRIVAKVDYPPLNVRGEDVDGCNFEFEGRFLGSNPYLPDTDKDGIEDCDEALIYGLNPLENEELTDYLGISNLEGLIYTQKKPLFVGHAKHPVSQIEFTKTDPFVSFGLFFLEVQKDDNFAEFSPVILEDGEYEAELLYDDKKQNDPEYFRVDSSLEYEPLTVSFPDNFEPDAKNNIVTINGKTGPSYGVVAIWENEDFVDVSAVIADRDGGFIINAPQSYENGKYKVTLYALYKKGDSLIQTNYDEMSFSLEDEKVYISRDAIKKTDLKIQSTLKYLNADVGSLEKTQLKNNSSNYMTLLSFSVFLVFSLAIFLVLWRKK